METYTLPLIVIEIEKQHKAGNTLEAARLFQIVYAHVREHAYKVYVGILFAALKTTKDSPRAEEVFLEIIDEVERFIHKGKFPEKETDEQVIKHIVQMVRDRAYHRTLNKMKKWNRTKVLRSADLPDGTLGRLPAEANTLQEDTEHLKQGIAFVFRKLSAKDADLLRTRYYGSLTQQDADVILMERYSYSKLGSLHKAIWWAEQRFKAHWKEFLRLHDRQINNTNLKTQPHETPS